MSDSKLKILLLADSRSFHTERLVRELRRQECSVLLASIERGHRMHFHLSRKKSGNVVTYITALPRVRKLVLRFNPDIINAHVASGYGFQISLLDRRTAPRILHLWGSDVLVVPHKSLLHRYKVIRALRSADCVVADSDFLAASAGALSTLKRVETIPWGIEREFLTCHKNDYTINKPLRIIVPRAHEKVYNNISIVQALASLIREEKVSIVFPAFGSRFENYCVQARKLVGDRVRYYQPLPRKEFMNFMASFDVYLSAARSDSSPISLIEAMALGLIPIAADIPGIREWLGTGNGYLYADSDPDQLQSLVQDLLTTSNLHEQMRKTNLEKVKEHGIFEDNVTRQIELMKQVAGSYKL